MRAVTAVLYVALAVSVNAQNQDIEKNDVDSKPSVRLDPFIRKALLRALSELEANEPSSEIETGDATADELLKSGDDITEASGTKEADVKYHSYVVDGRKAFANNSSEDQSTLVRENFVITSTIGNVENQFSASNPTPDPFNELFQTKESNNLQQVRSIQNSNTNQAIKASKKIESNEILKPTTTTTTTIKTTLKPTTTTTTTTTPKPTHNKDGENIEEVSHKDVQVFSAPLVAAFTVHQDALGLPRKVEPIYKQQNGAQAITAVPAVPTSPPAQTDFIAQQLSLQRELEQKQKLLEEQLRLLQLQQIQHEDLLRAQQLALQQNDPLRQQAVQHQERLQTLQQEEIKKQQILQEHQRLHQQNFNQATAFQNQQILQNNLTPTNVQQNQNSLVTVQPSLSFDASNSISNQQLPNREAVDFLLHLRHQQREQFPLQQNHLPHGLTNLNLPQQTQNPPAFRPLPATGSFQQPPGVNNFKQPQSNVNFHPIQAAGPFQSSQPNNNFQQSQQNVNTLSPQPNNNFQQLHQNPNTQSHQPAGNFRPQLQFNNFPQLQQTGNFQQQQVFQQQLPDTRLRSFNQGPQPFLQQSGANLGINTIQQLSHHNDFVPAQNFRQSNRVFRQESGTGNFGINSNSNRFNVFPANQRFIRPQVNFHSSDAELQHLLQQSGLSGRSHEDINIVSKVLSLNHGISPNNFVSNLLNAPNDGFRRNTGI